MLDASALLCYLNAEDGAEVVEEAMGNGAWIGAVNWAEVLSKTAEEGGDPEALESRLTELGLLGGVLRVAPFTREEALAVGRLRPLTKDKGLSLGDRACLALGLRLESPIYTADRSWEGLDVGADVRLVRR